MYHFIVLKKCLSMRTNFNAAKKYTHIYSLLVRATPGNLAVGHRCLSFHALSAKWMIIHVSTILMTSSLCCNSSLVFISVPILCTPWLRWEGKAPFISDAAPGSQHTPLPNYLPGPDFSPVQKPLWIFCSCSIFPLDQDKEWISI